MPGEAPHTIHADRVNKRAPFLGGPVSILILLLVLAAILWNSMGSPERMTRVAQPLLVSKDETSLEFYLGGRYVLEGSWELTDALQEAPALLFMTREAVLFATDALGVLEPGEHTPRFVMDFPKLANFTEFDTPRMLGWVQGGDALVGWLDNVRQLCRIDIANGTVTTLATFPGQRFANDSSEWWRLDHPIIDRRDGMIEDAALGRLFFLAELIEPIGSYALVSVALAGGDDQWPFVETPAAGDVLSWDLSLERGELFVLVATPIGQELRVHDLAGHGRRTLPLPETGALNISLSPDERTLLVEREWKPASALEDRVALDRWARPSTAEGWRRVDARYGGFVLIDLDSDTAQAGPSAGRNAAWSPDGSRIAYLEDRQLRMWNVGASKSRLVARSEAASPENMRSSCRHVPQWSSDGKALLTCCATSSELVVLELDRRSFVMLYANDSDHLWAPAGRPMDW